MTRECAPTGQSMTARMTKDSAISISMFYSLCALLLKNGNGGAQQKKIYDLDENGEKIPVIDKRTGQQKVDKRNRKQWKCHTADSTDWNSRENAKMWRKDLADTINATNEQLGIALHWEHRSFKEQGLTESRQSISGQLPML